MKLPRRRFLHLAASAAAVPTLPRIAQAQAYQSRPVRIISAVVSTPRVHWRAILGIGRGIANARARSVAAPIANREPQKSTAGGRKCGQLFSVEREDKAPNAANFFRSSAKIKPFRSNRKTFARSALTGLAPRGYSEAFTRLAHRA